MSDLIKKIIEGDDIDKIFAYVLGNIYKNGPVSVTDMEILSYLALYQPEIFAQYRDSILNYMGIFYKESSRKTLKDVVFGQYRKYIKDTFKKDYTPVQANIVKGIDANRCFSFSAPTSTGKSFVFMDMIAQSQHDVVVVVPSRALINEYYLKLCELINDKTVNILTFIDKINTSIAKRNIFIVTPERCRELFRQKENFIVDLFLFDEAQLSNEDSKRGLYFDSIVRRCQKAYPNAKFVFAHPFVQNPDSQIQKNHFDVKVSSSIQYKQKNVGQIFLSIDDNWNFYHFGIEKSIMGNRKLQCDFDPIMETIKNEGSVLFYISKTKIYNGSFRNQFSRYINLCKEIVNEKMDVYIDQLKLYTGGDTIDNKNYYSQMIALMKRGIVIHHGSLPLQTRIIIEQFTRAGFCKICFATSTLEQGINMPFDVVYLDRLEKSKPLSVKNLIGRAGRSTEKSEFDHGFVVISTSNNISNFRNIMTQDEVLDNVSALEKNKQHDDDYNEFKDAIINDTFSDEYNLTEKELTLLTADAINKLIEAILDSIFKNNQLVSLVDINADDYCRLQLYDNFNKLYSTHVGRDLTDAEKYVLNTAIKIMIWRVYGKTFKNICWYRYSYVSQSHEREKLKRLGKKTDFLNAKFMTGFHDIPDKSLRAFGLFPEGTKAEDVDYDLVMCDTYDYIDKLIGFKLSDIFYAAFFKYYERKNDVRAFKLAKYIKYGTDNERHIWMLRYGLSFEDIEVLDEHIDRINSEAIVFKNTINNVPEELKMSIVRFL
jgi:superfamily II DNA/RNA helicase